MSEFEDMQNENLGELPDGITQERGETYLPQPLPDPGPSGVMDPRYRQPLDIQTEERARQRPGAPSSGEVGSVTSIYNTRPVHGRDFIHTDFAILDSNLDAELTYTVPNGYIGALNGFRFCPLILVGYYAADLNTSDPADDLFFRGTILHNNSPVPEYSDIKLNQYESDGIKCHLVVDEGDTISLKLHMNNNLWFQLVDNYLGAGFDDVIIEMELYGQNLLKRGLSLPFEITTKK